MNERILTGINGQKISLRSDNLTDKVFGRLTVKKYLYTDKHRKSVWECVCDCGQTVNVKRGELVNGDTKSCGCLQRETITTRSTTHGLRKSRAYRAWGNMMSRCYNVRGKEYKHYGARGIKVCKMWHKFPNFYEDMSECPAGYSIERINVNGNYEPNNCDWIPRNKQNRNKRNSRLITFNGETHCLSEWAERLGIKPDLVKYRLRYGWSVERAFFEKPFVGKNQHSGWPTNPKTQTEECHICKGKGRVRA